MRTRLAIPLGVGLALALVPAGSTPVRAQAPDIIDTAIAAGN